MQKKLKDIEEVKEIVKSSVRIEDVVEDIYDISLRNAGTDSLKAICPFHEDTDPSFGISLDKQLFYCHGCHKGGDVFSFMQSMESIPFVTAIKRLADFGDVDISKYYRDLTEEEKRQQKLYEVNKEIEKKAFVNSQFSDEFEDWIDKRKLDSSILDKYGVGYSGDSITDDIDEPDVKDLNLSWHKKWNNRITIPLRDKFGRTAGFRTRSTDGSSPKSIATRSNHPLDVPPVYGLYEARRAIRDKGYVILVEGEVDVWQMASHGFENVVATLGSKLNKNQIEYLNSLNIRDVILLPDADEAGRHFSLAVARIGVDDLSIKIATLESGDPDDTLLRNPEEVKKAIKNAKHSLEYLVDRTIMKYDVESITGKFDILEDLDKFLENTDGHKIEIISNYLSDKLAMSPESLIDYFRSSDRNKSGLHNIEAERVVLSNMIKDEEFCGDSVVELNIEDFYLKKHKTIFSIIDDLYKNNKKIDSDTVATKLKNDGYEKLVGYLNDIIEIKKEGSSFLINDIKDKSIRRYIRKRSMSAVRKLEDTSIDANSVLQDFSGDIAKTVVGGKNALTDIKDSVDSTIRRMHKRIKNPKLIIGLDLGEDWSKLNHSIHGLQRNTYFVLAAPSGVGKTAIASIWARRISVDLNEPTLFFTFETGKEILTRRMISSMSGIEQDKIKTGMFNDKDEIEKVQNAAKKISSSPIIMTERGRTFEEAQAIIRHDVLRRNTRVVFVDYVQLMHLSNSRGMNKYNEIGEISGGLLNLAKELGITIVAVAQINREGAKRRKITKEDVGDSYIISRDSDIFYIVRMKTEEEIEIDGLSKGDRFAILDKNRDGREGITSSIVADMTTMRIREYKN